MTLRNISSYVVCSPLYLRESAH